ncbi:MAG: four helix bundle protein [Candidatus Peribacteraceae bacterium]|jgi:four helix bundle protein|nr:four helix bundle protein [Candidatus Peribacteraceae bacterium]MDP7247733.1 four helix bundle protein [Candidatus Peribacteraceae bacterium]MDP7454375.1 four helix bundle protein [Candidatus Peribacteraceae bacterium]MDP7646219.1 four helix bundle protein [Candidatus Peribacteraceae bacterium]HCI03534.1 hypothetical protein [Candidatus Peribacteria bacterium]|tara:strand:- start:275 stop:631 length:357 start_codon:yes stop_codon:yes gene_type:complete
MQERQYQKLIVWKEAHKLCKKAYEITKNFPPDERYGLKSQMRRSGYSVPMNIAEGNSKRTKKGKSQFLDIAVSSLEEFHYQRLLAFELGYVSKEQQDDLLDHIQRVGFLLHKLRLSLR